jgi:hypothetical protein
MTWPPEGRNWEFGGPNGVNQKTGRPSMAPRSVPNEVESVNQPSARSEGWTTAGGYTGHMPSSPGPPRRSFRFSLGTFFVLLTIFCIWLSVQAQWIRDRRKYLSEHPDALEFQIPPTIERAGAPGLLGLFGEQGVTVLAVAIQGGDPPREISEFPEVQQAKQLFPEAKILACRGEGRERYAIGFDDGTPFQRRR